MNTAQPAATKTLPLMNTDKSTDKTLMEIKKKLTADLRR
jgi:hypothetical protein